jgi:hypothetical protein
LHVVEERFLVADAEVLSIFERHAGALGCPVQRQLLVPAALDPDRRLGLKYELDDVVLRANVVPEDERSG